MKQKNKTRLARAAMTLLLALLTTFGAWAQVFSENFEGGTMPDGWTTDGLGTWSVGTGDYSSSTGAGQGTYNAKITHSTTGNVTKLITPEIDLSTVTSAELSFMHIQRSWSGDTDQLRVYYRTSTDGEWTQLLEYTAAVTTWTTEEGIALPNLSSTYQIAFEMTDKYGYGVGVDNVKIVQGASCPKPAGLNVTTNALTATFTWQSDADWFEIAHSTNADANPDDAITAVATTNSYNFTDLALGDHYVWVRTVCGTTEQSGWAGPLSFHIGYCVPAPTYVDKDGISNVTFGTGDNVVNNDTPKATYADYSTQIGAVQAGVESNIAITFKTGYTYNTYVWVDLDNSLSFDADEVVCYGESTNSNPTTLTLNFTIPATQATGDYRMRIGSADSGLGSDPANANPCYTSSYACFQDYTLRVLEAPSCLTPTGLAVTTDGASATATWNGTADTYNIDINGTVTNNVTSPYTFNVELSTTYSVKVQADCGSDWTNPVSITTPDCIGGHTIEYTLTDGYGDGWNGASITIMEGCGDIVETLTVTDASNTGTLSLCGDYYEFIWNSGSYDSECSFTFTEGGTTLFTKPSSISNGLVLYTIGTNTKPTGLAAGTPGTHEVALTWTPGDSETAWQICLNKDESNIINIDNANSTINEGTVSYTLTGLTADTEYSVMVRAFIDDDAQSCWSNPVTFTTAEACPKPTNLAETNITTNSATLSWEGYNDSYVLQYRPWNPAGDDIITTGEMVTYTVDLSQYEGTGSVAIRHYDISDMFQLIVDNIEVTNAAGTVVYSQDFEDCGGNMPAEFSNMDLDGDGYMWEIASSPASNVDGSYGIVSASYDNNAGALTPDNWLILSGIEMGGQMTFQARGQDPQYAAENFAIYVSTENSIVEVPVTATTYNATNLTPNTPYAWQVKGICGDEETSYVSSFFKTKDDMLVFATDGNWNDVANWTDAEGNIAEALPTNDNNVRIDAAAVIPEGAVAQANKVTINGGSITIKDGGQLKQSSATLRVTMEKEITGYVEGNGNYYFIGSPFNGRTKLGNDGSTWSLVDNILEGEYNLYAFDPTAELEWINYEEDNQHISFLSEPTGGGSGNPGMLYCEGYLYANQEGTTLEFIGTTGKSNNYSESRDFTYDDSSSDVFNGWKLIGNPFTCNGYITYSGDATFYKMNGAGLEAYENGVVLAPGEGAFMKVSASGTITYSSEAPEGFTSTSTTAAGILPLLPSHGETTNQDANLSEEIVNITFAKEGYATYYNGEKDVMLTAGMKAHVVTDGSTNLTYAGVADGDTDENVVPAGTAVLLQVEATESDQELSVYLVTPSAAAYAGTNLLFGSDEETTTTGGEKYYKLTYSNNNDKFGWYWGAANGAAFTSPAHKAWLALPASGAPSFLGLPDWDTTGIVPASVNPEDGEWYTLQGLKIGKKPTTKGVYIHNGRKVIVK